MRAQHDLRGWAPFAAMAGAVMGAALQLQQAGLWPAWRYAALAGATSLALCGVWRARRHGRGVLLVLLLFAALVSAGLTGWRAAVYADDALDPSLEGRDLQVTGVIAQMPQHDDSGTRFRLDVESARWAGESAGEPPLPHVPRRIALGWYAEGTGLWGRGAEEASAAPQPLRRPDALHAGERWRLTVRLKAPHGNLNPHGFDQELQLWEQGVRATGYVRTGARDAPPERLATTWQRPVERAREAVRDAIFERVTDRRRAGVIAALVTGDQGAIDLLSYKGLVTPRNSAFRGKKQSSALEATKGVLFPGREHIWVATNDVLFPTFLALGSDPLPRAFPLVVPCSSEGIATSGEGPYGL